MVIFKTLCLLNSVGTFLEHTNLTGVRRNVSPDTSVGHVCICSDNQKLAGYRTNFVPSLLFSPSKGCWLHCVAGLKSNTFNFSLVHFWQGSPSCFQSLYTQPHNHLFQGGTNEKQNRVFVGFVVLNPDASSQLWATDHHLIQLEYCVFAPLQM